VANRYSLGGDRRRSNPLSSILRVILELVVIVLGIYIAFRVDRWNDGKEQQMLKKKFLQELKAEASANLEELIADQRNRRVQVLLFEKLIQAASRQVADDTIRMAIDELLRHRFYSGTNAAFDNIVASGNLRLIADDSTRSKLFELKRFESKAPLVEASDVDLINNQIEPYLTRRQVLYLLELKLADNSPESTVSIEQSARVVRTLLTDRTFIDLIYLRLSRVRQTLYFETPLGWRLEELIELLDQQLANIEIDD